MCLEYAFGCGIILLLVKITLVSRLSKALNIVVSHPCLPGRKAIRIVAFVANACFKEISQLAAYVLNRNILKKLLTVIWDNGIMYHLVFNEIDYDQLQGDDPIRLHSASLFTKRIRTLAITALLNACETIPKTSIVSTI